jgi:hypothetical protein
VEWSPGEVLTAVRSSLGADRPYSQWTYERADLDGDQVLVVFRVSAAAPVRPELGATDRFGVRYSLAELPDGPNTGISCDTPQRWADEIAWDLDEQVDTGLVVQASRAPGPDGLVLLQWRW